MQRCSMNLAVVLTIISAATAWSQDSRTIALSSRESALPPLLEKPVSLDLKNVAVAVALMRLHEASDVAISFSPTMLPEARRVSCACRSTTLSKALDTILKGTAFGYVPLHDQVVIIRQTTPQLSHGDGLLAPAPPRGGRFAAPGRVSPAARRFVERQATVTGSVAELGTGRPLFSVRLQISGTNLGALTDAEGRFAIPDVPAGEAEVCAQLIGFRDASQTVSVPSEGIVTVDFQLEPDPLALDELVVVGYGTAQRRDLTGSVASVQAEQIGQIPTANLVQAIQGRAAGVDVVRTSSVPGAGMQIRIRGVRSMSNDDNRNDPLFVVDGVPLAGGIQDFTPADIQSIEILKDASATAIYGSRGANGVVLITTKTGATGGPAQITYNGYAGMQRPLSVELVLNGESLGFRRTSNYSNNTIKWHVPYEKGRIVATGYKADREVASYELRTAGEPAQILLSADRTQVAADGRDLSHIAIRIVDAQGVVVARDDSGRPDAER